MRINSLLKAALCTVALTLLAASAGAALVTWDLNPTNANGSVGGSSHTFTSSGFSIGAYGFNADGSSHDLWYKNIGADHGLGIPEGDNELQVGPNGPLQFIQFDLTSILSLGMTGGQVKVSSVDAATNEVFDIYGSNTLGSLGTKISIAGGYHSGADNMFVNIPSFGSFKFISIATAVGDVLPWALAANMPAIPETGGAAAAFALLAFFAVVMATRKIGAKYNS